MIAPLFWSQGAKDVVAGTAGYAAKFPGVSFSRVAVTNRSFNGTARVQAARNHVKLIDFDGLADMLRDKPVKMKELMAYL